MIPTSAATLAVTVAMPLVVAAQELAQSAVPTLATPMVVLAVRERTFLHSWGSQQAQLSKAAAVAAVLLLAVVAAQAAQVVVLVGVLVRQRTPQAVVVVPTQGLAVAQAAQESSM